LANGLLRRGYETMIGTTEVAESNSTPLRFELSQNYPNPIQLSGFHSSAVTKASTRIPVLLAAGVYVELNVFNLLGQKVATVFRGYLPAGKHEFTFDGSGLPVGIYFYRLEADGRVLYRKMVVQ
jgi:hypothetical protein